MFINCLVDTGAAYSLCSHDIIPPNVIISPTSVQLCGVTGAPLHILGAATLPVSFGVVRKTQQLIVTTGINHKIILGRNFMSATDCEISFKNLTLSIDDQHLPLIKASSKPYKHFLVANTTLAIKPSSVALVKCNLMKRGSSNKQNQSQAYISTTGIVHPQLRCVTSSSGF